MKAIELNVPDEVYQKLETMASRDHQPVNDFAVKKIEELVRALDSFYDLEKRAQAGDRNKFSDAMAQVPKTAPTPGDEL